MTGMALVVAADRAYFPLAKGLLLSLATLPADVTVVYLDIGLDPDQRAWVADRGVRIVEQAAIDAAIVVKPAYPIQRYMTAQLVRPFLPKLLPEYAALAWLDSDMWVQDVTAIEHLRFLVANHPLGMAVAPLIDPCYWPFYRDQTPIHAETAGWYRGLFGDFEATAFATRCLFSSGLVAAARTSPVWGRWRDQLARAVQRPVAAPLLRHLAEQTALNVALHAEGDFLPLGSWFNYNCHLGMPMLRPNDGRVVRALPPFEPLGIVHLSDFRLRAAEYLGKELLYQRGAYLSDGERAALAALQPHV